MKIIPIIFFISSQVHGALVVSDSRLLWPKGVLPYVINSDTPFRNKIQIAINELNKFKIVKVVPRTNENNYIYFTTNSSPWCESSVGMQGGAQAIRLTTDCSAADILHELMHALGFHHEQQRPDRNKYVHIYSGALNRSNDHDIQHEALMIGTYDIFSIMHNSNHVKVMTLVPGSPFLNHHESGYSGNDILTIENIQTGDFSLNPLRSLSKGDQEALRKMYN